MLTVRRMGGLLKRGMLLGGLLFGALLTAPVGARQSPTTSDKVTSPEKRFYERLIAQVEPTLVGNPERLPLYLQLFKREMIDDPRRFPFDVQPTWQEDDTVLLTGFVGFEENRIALLKFLRCLGFEKIDARIEVLPSEKLGPRRFAFVKVSHSLVFDHPTARREVLADGLLGFPLYLLKEAADGFFLCHGIEGYVGYIDGRHLQRVDPEQFARYQVGPQVRLRRDHQDTHGLLLPVAARLKWVRNEAATVIAELPTGQEVAIPRDRCELHRNVPSRRVERVVDVASQMLGTKYLWGGNTSKGIDCSGLVQTAFMAEGINLARDAGQQAYLGSLTATRWYREGMRRGDTLYFLGRNGKISHTAIYVGDGRYLESVEPVVRYTSFNPQDKDYDQRRSASFCFAKRLLD